MLYIPHALYPVFWSLEVICTSGITLTITFCGMHKMAYMTNRKSLLSQEHRRIVYFFFYFPLTLYLDSKRLYGPGYYLSISSFTPFPQANSPLLPICCLPVSAKLQLQKKWFKNTPKGFIRLSLATLQKNNVFSLWNQPSCTKKKKVCGVIDVANGCCY